MRMWGVDPSKMCRKHLLGEHVEMHMFVGVVNKGKSIKGYLSKRLINPIRVQERHNQLVNEMIKRGYNHNSPLPKVKVTKLIYIADYSLDLEQNEKDLRSRCKECDSKYIKEACMSYIKEFDPIDWNAFSGVEKFEDGSLPQIYDGEKVTAVAGKGRIEIYLWEDEPLFRQTDTKEEALHWLFQIQLYELEKLNPVERSWFEYMGFKRLN